MLKQRRLWSLFPVVLMLFCATDSFAQLSAFSDGPTIKGYGKKVEIPGQKFTPQQSFSVAFDVAAGAEAGEINRRFDSLARFINMHTAAGVPKENIQLALVVHGKASIDLLNNETYQRVHQTDNPNLGLLAALQANQVRVILCGQSATAYEIEHSQLAEGVEVALSAMTAHALLQQQGYSVNPF
ncbi:DsrE family protein [Alteromonas flava]|uniref:DsrE family protein n=1 Tax=Alteromonas flava TaxID=2048003 RepID=UPI001F0B7E43|nr:DsrE family protein [Alteromonas flava]